jgi:hypothetical protein
VQWRGERVERGSISLAGFFFRQGRADEAHRQAAHDPLALADGDADALQAAGARQDREGVAVPPDALEGGDQLRILAHAEIAQHGAAFLGRAEGEPGAAERARQDRAAALQRRSFERHRAFRRRRMADRHGALLIVPR